MERSPAWLIAFHWSLMILWVWRNRISGMAIVCLAPDYQEARRLAVAIADITTDDLDSPGHWTLEVHRGNKAIVLKKVE